MQTITMQGVKVTIPTEATLGSGIVEVNQYAGNMSVETERIIGTVNTPIPFRVQCSLPINDTFAVPLEGLFGAQGKTVSLTFENGIAERDVLFDVSGEWRITEAQINAHLPFGSQFRFAGLSISITE